MKQFDRDAECSKCGSIRIKTKYQLKFSWINVLLLFITRWEFAKRNEFMIRKCVSCGYKWKEYPLDHKEKRNSIFCEKL